jgi:hypothetical protein
LIAELEALRGEAVLIPDAEATKQDAEKQALNFEKINVNICLFQQFSLLLDWWVPLEAKHNLGFSSRILMAPTCRAIVSKETGLLEADTGRPIMQHIWKHAAQHWGTSAKHQKWLLRSSTAAQQATR